MTVNFAGDAAVPAVAAPGAPAKDPKWKAVGFLNYDIPADTPTGWGKLGAIPLTMEDHSEILEFILADPAKTERRVAQMFPSTDKMRVTYRSATKKARGFKLVDAMDATDEVKAA